MKASTGGAAPRSWALPAVLVLIGVSVAALVYVLFAPASKPEPVGFAHYATGAMAHLEVLAQPPVQPAEPLADASGADTTLAAFHGQVTLVNLWATWCAPCMEEMPTLAALQRRFAGRMRVIPVSVDADSERDQAKAELARLSGGTLPFFNDRTRAILFSAQASAMPTSILYDAEGRELARVTGDTDWSTPEAAAFIEAALAQAR